MRARIRAFRTVSMLFAVALSSQAADHWIRVTTPHFEMYTTADEKKARETILHFERVREFFMRASPVKPPGEFPTRIVAFKDTLEFKQYAPNKISAAYFAPGPLRDSIVMQDPSPENYPVTIHEYVHLVVRHSGLRLPLWLNEGWAEVYSTLKPVKDGVAVGDLIQHHMAALDRGQWFSLSELQAIDNKSPDYNESARTGIFYAESWALAHMLYLAPDYKDNFGKFITALHRGRSIDEALQTAYNKSTSQVSIDLRTYLTRRKLFGTVFLTPFQKSDEEPVVADVTAYDSGLMLADLYAASNHPMEADRSYRRLQGDEPKRPEAFAGAGYLALLSKDIETARQAFEKALELGTTDAQLCVQLASLEHSANQPVSASMSALERAVKLRPDFTEALYELGLMKLDARDFDASLALLSRVNAVAPDRMLVFYTALAYSNLQKGNLDAARMNAEAARKAAKTTPESQSVERLVQVIEARSKGPAAAHPNEKLLRAEGTAVGLRCAAQGSGGVSKMGVTVNGQQMLFDVPDAAAVEVVRTGPASGELKCGPLQPFKVVLEYAEYTPGSVASRGAAGIVRRVELP